MQEIAALFLCNYLISTRKLRSIILLFKTLPMLVSVKLWEGCSAKKLVGRALSYAKSN
jgi:hypothetical protein